MEREIVVGGKAVRMRASALIPRLYRFKFGRDLIKDMSQLEAAYKKSVSLPDDASDEQRREAQLSILDLTIFEKFSVEAFVTWTNNHQDVLNTMHVITPLVGLVVYYISYRISCFLYERRELGDD